MPSLTRHITLAAALAALALPAGALAQKSRVSTGWMPESTTAFDYVANASKLSKARFETEKTVIKLPAYDGKLLYIEVTKPKAKYGKRRYPTILEASPYHGTVADREGTRILPEPRDDDGRSIGLTGYFAPRGYAVVMMDLRGTGRSQGCLDHLGPKDARDLKQVVEWAAAQDWSNGRVGMTGHSYVGSTPMVAAAQRPKGLRTIVPSAGLASMYHHQFQDGVPYFLQWTGVQWSYEYLTVARKLPPVGAEPVQGANTGDDFGNDTEETGCGAPNSALTAGEDQFSGRYTDWHLHRDWNDGATNADIPVFAVHGVNDNAARVPALEWYFRRQDPRDKLWIGQWDHGVGVGPNRRGMQWTAALHAWFDKLLAGNRVPTGPDIEMFMADDQSFSEVRNGARTEILKGNDLPLANSRLQLFPSGADAGLGTAKPVEEGSASFQGTAAPFREAVFVGDPTWTSGTSFSTAPMAKDVVLAGLPELEITASFSAPRSHLIANVLDEDADGKRRRITQFAIAPELRNGIATRTPVVPGEKYLLRPTGMFMAQHVRKGHRLVLQVTTSDPDKAPFFANDPQVTVFTGPEATKLTLPVVTVPKLAADDVALFPGESFRGPAHAPVDQTVTTAAPGLVAKADQVTTTNVEFDIPAGQDNAKMEGSATPATAADLDLFLEKQIAGQWTEIADGRNDGSTTEELISTGRLKTGKYRLVIHNFLGAPANEVAVALRFFNTEGQAG